MNLDFRKYKCGEGKCKASLPDIYCEKLPILRSEIPQFIRLMDELDNPVLFYLIIPPRQKSGEEHKTDIGTIYIWIDVRKHKYDPNDLVHGAGNIACGMLTMEEEKEFFAGYDRTAHEQFCRELNCPVCSKNYTDNNSWVMKENEPFTVPFQIPKHTNRKE